MIAEAPEQWYTFKPMWPAHEAEVAALASRAAQAHASEAAAGAAP
jgi:hypothetical protein